MCLSLPLSQRLGVIYKYSSLDNPLHYAYHLTLQHKHDLLSHTRSNSLPPLLLWRRHALQPLKRRLLEGLSVVGVGNLDEGVSSLSQVLPEEVRDAPLGHQVVEVSSRRHHASTCKRDRVPFIYRHGTVYNCRNNVICCCEFS